MNRVDLDETALVIASPCTVPWESMSGDRVKRFCGQCRLHVHDVSEMTRGEVKGLLESTGGTCCLRVWRRPDGRVITKDCDRVLRAIRRRLAAMRVAAAGLLALVGLGGCKNAGPSGRSYVAPPPAGAGSPVLGTMGTRPTMGTPAPIEPPPVKGATVETGK